MESIYERVRFHELKKYWGKVISEVFIPYNWDDTTFENSFRADLIVDEKVNIEIKSVFQFLQNNY